MLELFFQVGFGLACLLICAYFFFELHYFGRSLVSVVWAKCKKKVHVLEETSVRGICLTTDIDTLLTHMNNARFLRELDFAKIDFFERSDLFRLIRKHKGSICLGATTVRYRRYIKLFSLYKIISKIIYWDSQSIYMEHRFTTSCDDFVNAIVFCRTRIANCDVEALMSEALLVPEDGDLEHAKREKPPLTPVLKKWIEHNELSSALLRSASKMEPQSGEAPTDVGAGKYAKEVNGNAKKLSKEIIDQTVIRPFDVIGCSNPTFSDQN